MTTRSDVTVYYHLDPRLIIIAAPSTEMTMQDLHDTLQDIDDEPANMSYPHLVQSAGKDDLGGGVTVGITLTLRNAQIAFARRETIVTTGTVTSDSPTGAILQKIIDTSATFITDGVARGMWVSNNTRAYPCEVISVDSETQLTVLTSTGGDWTTGDTYAIWETAVCDLTGGNLVATDYDGNTISAVFPTYGNTITKTSSASATLTAQQQLEYGTFDGGVHVDLSSSYSGTTYPIGTPQQSVNNFSDALTIAQTRGFTRLYIKGDATFGTGLDFTGLEIIGESRNKSTFTITSGANVTNCEFALATVQGTLDGGNVLDQCALLTINYVDGIIKNCLLLETVTLSGSATAFFLDCWSGVPGSNTPTIDMGGSGSELAIRNYSGGIRLTNRTGTDPCSIDMNSGQIIIDDTVTNGTITLRGVAKWTNEKTYAGGATINTELITFQDTQQMAFEGNRVHITQNSGYSGTAYPRGTSRMPVDNIADALVIASGQELNDFHIEGLITIPSGADVSNKDFEATNGYQGQLYFTPGCITDNVGVRRMGVLGTFNGRQYLENCSLLNVKNLWGNIEECVLVGALSLDTTATNDFVTFTNCYTSKITEPYPTLDFQGSGVGAYFTRYAGAIEFINKTGGDEVWFTGNNSPIIINDSVASGDIYLGGLGEWVNKSTYAGTATVVDNFTHDVNVVQVSGEQVHIDDFKGGTLSGIVDANVVQVSGEYVSMGTNFDTNITQVSGIPVSINDFVGEAASLTNEGISNAVWNSVMDAGYTAEETMKIMIAALAGKLSGAEGATIRIRDINDTKDRIVATVTPSGNRTVVTLDGS